MGRAVVLETRDFTAGQADFLCGDGFSRKPFALLL
jgi:hypothetical protein